MGVAMNFVSNRLRRLSDSLHGLLFRPMRVTRVGRQWQVAFAPPPAVTVDTRREAVMAHLAAMSPQRLHRMRRQLSHLMRRHPGARAIFRHLTAVEYSLRRRDGSAFASLPTSVLSAALEQLQTVVGDWSALGLHDLRAAMQFALAQRGHATTPPVVADALPMDFARGLHVQDASVSMFIEAEHGWGAMN